MQCPVFYTRHYILYMLISVSGILVNSQVYAHAEFEEEFLHPDKNGVSPEIFIYNDAIAPGLKKIDVKVNEQLVGQKNIYFISQSGRQVEPCLTFEAIKSMGIKVQLYDGWVKNIEGGGINKEKKTDITSCEKITERIPLSEAHYDNAQQTLYLTVPQEAVDKQSFTMISPLEWDHGTPSIRTSYNGYYYSSRIKNNSKSGKDTVDNTYINLNSVGSLDVWRLYSNDTFYKNNKNKWKATHDRSYLARDIAMLRSQVQVGEIYSQTSGYMTGSVPLSGVSLSTNERMTFDNQFSYAPIIRGMARTNARILVRQRGNIIYSSTLTPGAFAIDDLYTAQVGADLDVTVEEADGQRQVFHVPFTALPNMIRPRAIRYSLAAGKYRNQSSNVREPIMVASSLEYGFENFTAGSAILASDRYQTISTGIAWNVGAVGAFSTEIAQARYREKRNTGKEQNGSAIRFQFARYFDVSNTSLQILGYQYRSKNFLDFPEFLARENRSQINGYDYGELQWGRRKRNRFEIMLNQDLSGYGTVYLALSQDRFYGTDHKNTSISGGAGTTIGNTSLALSLTQSSDRHVNDRQISLSISMPFGSSHAQNYGSLSYGLIRDRDHRYSQSLGYSGNAQDGRISYSTNLQRNSMGKYSQSGTLGYSGSKGTVSAGISRSHNVSQFSAGVNGGVTLYGGGGILSPVLGNTVAIVDTSGASGIGVSGSGYSKTDYFGHAMVTWLTPYRYNDISLDPISNNNVELRETSRRIVPSEGAAVLLKFSSRVGRRALVELKSVKPIPLGALVYINGEKEEAGIVGNKGVTYLSGLDARKSQTLEVVWGDTSSARCRFSIPAATKEQNQPNNWYKKIIAPCQ